ncbi:DUF559 domain-containing protein [Bifidobacterium cuniculi]|uniref:DUF559 domain-containing protein n=1 Tax=Bifidobacterium cuniculi TaxID=1688 RepID=A0A087AWQ3_9BIFI|nr:DUF559 domain-containing protein [Bifidobacterium cuniculi]KFI63203.1 hypothetical protein BCUN_1129 [Bifidobacterium cuniculi]
MKDEMLGMEMLLLTKAGQRSIEAAQRCLDAEARCHRRVACVFALGAALRLLGVSYEPRLEDGGSGAVGSRLGAELLQVVIGPGECKPKDHCSRQRQRKRFGADRAAYFVCNVPVETVEVAPGVTCTSVPFTWFMMARWLSLEELVVLGDAMMQRKTLHERVTLESFEDMLSRVERHVRERGGGCRAPHGIGRCRMALRLMAEGTDSPMETRLRLTLERYGLPRPVVNLPLELEDGSHVFLDLAFEDARVSAEYDGRHHAEQWEQDSVRRLGIESAGWAYVQVVNESMASESGRKTVAELVARLIAERTGVNWLLPKPLTLEQVARRKRRAGKYAKRGA